MFKKIIFSCCCFLTTCALADTYTGKVEKIDLHGDNWGTYSNTDIGIMSLYVEGMPKSCNQTNGKNRVVIQSNHQLFNSVLSAALAAKIADKEITIHYLNSCSIRSGAWDFGYISIK